MELKPWMLMYIFAFVSMVACFALLYVITVSGDASIEWMCGCPSASGLPSPLAATGTRTIKSVGTPRCPGVRAEALTP